MIWKKAQVLTLVCVFVCTASLCCGADAIFLSFDRTKSLYERQLETVGSLYGLDIRQVDLRSVANRRDFRNALRDTDLKTIVATAEALEILTENGWADDLRKTLSEKRSLLIFDIDSSTLPNILDEWSGGAILNCVSEWIDSARETEIRFDNDQDMNGPLRNLSMTMPVATLWGLRLHARGEAKVLLSASSDPLKASSPILVKGVSPGYENIFFLSRFEDGALPVVRGPTYGAKNFPEIAPMLIFFRFACGERCWHSTQTFANLTIDDPWLAQPYGYLDYAALLDNMKETGFHTTIGFVPWNYDRSDPFVVSLIKQSPKYYSICIHGNDHDHREYYKYETTKKDSWTAKPLAVQKAAIEQGLARMDEFHRLTSLDYDRVMVFPYGIAPARTLGLLKKDGFLATFNASNLPLGSSFPSDPAFGLRAVSIDFEGFASFRRNYPLSDQVESLIAVDLFLGNPVLFYGHHDDLFSKKNGMAELDRVVLMVKRRQRDVVWQGLGFIAQNYYLERTRADGVREARIFSPNTVLKNSSSRPIDVKVLKREPLEPRFPQVTADGVEEKVWREEKNIVFEVQVPAYGQCAIEIHYAPSPDLNHIAIAKTDMRINRLRRISDFRDRTLSTSRFGRYFVGAYSSTGTYQLDLKMIIAAVIGVVLAIPVVVSWVIRRVIRRRRFRARKTKPTPDAA